MNPSRHTGKCLDQRGISETSPVSEARRIEAGSSLVRYHLDKKESGLTFELERKEGEGSEGFFI